MRTQQNHIDAGNNPYGRHWMKHDGNTLNTIQKTTIHTNSIHKSKCIGIHHKHNTTNYKNAEFNKHRIQKCKSATKIYIRSATNRPNIWQIEREKLARSLFTALKKRPIDSNTTEKVVSKISRELEELGQSEIQSNTIGKKVMDVLKELDKIAYIRFASVYTNFKEVGEFEEVIEELHGKSKK